MQPMLDLLKTGFYHLKTEEAELKDRAAAKEKTGYAPRLKQSGRTDATLFSYIDSPSPPFCVFFAWHDFGMISSDVNRCSDSVCQHSDPCGHDIVLSVENSVVASSQPPYYYESTSCADTLGLIQNPDRLDLDSSVESAPKSGTMWAFDSAVRLAWEQRGSDGDDLYGCLGVPQDATKEQLRQSYLAGCKALHPDKPGGSNEETGKLSFAYQIMKAC